MTERDTPAAIRRRLRAESAAWVRKNLPKYLRLPHPGDEPEIDNDVQRDPSGDPTVAWQTWKEGAL